MRTVPSTVPKMRWIASAWLLAISCVLWTMALGVTLLSAPSLFRVYYSWTSTSPHEQDALTIVQWLSSSHRERSLRLAVTGGTLTEKELKHYSDVRRFIQQLPALVTGWAALTAIIIAVFRPSRPFLAATAKRAFSAWLLLVLGIGMVAWLDWKTFFALIHQPLFGERSWRLPDHSYSLRLFPPKFWQITSAIVLLAPGLALLLMGLALRLAAPRHSAGRLRLEQQDPGATHAFHE